MYFKIRREHPKTRKIFDMIADFCNRVFNSQLMCNQKIIPKIIQKVCNAGKALTFHNDSRTKLSLI